MLVGFSTGSHEVFVRMGLWCVYAWVGEPLHLGFNFLGKFSLAVMQGMFCQQQGVASSLDLLGPEACVPLSWPEHVAVKSE